MIFLSRKDSCFWELLIEFEVLVILHYKSKTVYE
jgi:hypothetical protein